MLEIDVTVRDSMRQFSQTRLFKLPEGKDPVIAAEAASAFVLEQSQFAAKQPLPSSVTVL